MEIKKHIRYLFIIAFMVFIANKLYIRPFVIEHDSPLLFQIFTFSVPNLIESIIGTLLLTGILLWGKQKWDGAKDIKDKTVYLIAVGLAALYVIPQELKLHNFGGKNIYDPNDLIASVIGLIVTFIIIRKFGFTN